MCFSLKPIGIVHVGLSDDDVKARFDSGVEGTIEVYEEYADCLEGIDGFSHLIVTSYLHKVSEEQRKVSKVKPKILRALGVDVDKIPEVGVFCTDSPHRPNPIAITVVELVERRGRLLRVKRLDLFDGTPIIDIKPYTPSKMVQELRLPGWYLKALEEAKRVNPRVKDF